MCVCVYIFNNPSLGADHHTQTASYWSTWRGQNETIICANKALLTADDTNQHKDDVIDSLNKTFIMILTYQGRASHSFDL